MHASECFLQIDVKSSVTHLGLPVFYTLGLIWCSQTVITNQGYFTTLVQYMYLQVTELSHKKAYVAMRVALLQ